MWQAPCNVSMLALNLHLIGRYYSRETGAQVLELSPVHEGDDKQFVQGENYITFMRGNRQNLKIAFGI